MLDDKEFAYLWWLIIILSILLVSKPLRNSFKEILRAFFQRKILIVLMSSIIYTFLIVTVLAEFNLWNLTLLKETILWFLFSATLMIFKSVSISNRRNYFIDLLNDNLAYTIAVEFIIGLSTFGFWVEFLFVPFALILGLMISYSENNNRYDNVNKFLNRFLLLSGLIIIICKIFMLTNSAEDYFTWDNVLQFLIAPLLFLMFLPYLFCFHLYVNYETAFLLLKNRVNNPILLHYTIWKALLHFRTDIAGLKRWSESVTFLNSINKEVVKKSIRKIKELQAIEKRPPVVDPRYGWSPYLVKEYLKDQGLISGNYFNYADEDWFACSPYLKLDENILPNNIAYYVNGNQKTATSMKLILNLNNFDFENKALDVFLEISTTLYIKVFGEEMTENLKQAVTNSIDICIEKEMYEICIIKNIWNSTNRNYNLNFEIFHKGIA
jgi:hypothetical protein